MRELEGRLRPRDGEVKDLQWQVQETTAQLYEAKLASSARRQRSLSNSMESRDRMHEVFERVATQSRDQFVEFSVTSIHHVLRDLCKGDKEDDGNGPSSGSNAV